MNSDDGWRYNPTSTINRPDWSPHKNTHRQTRNATRPTVLFRAVRLEPIEFHLRLSNVSRMLCWWTLKTWLKSNFYAASEVNRIDNIANVYNGLAGQKGNMTKWGAGRICGAHRHWSVLITWLIRILSPSPTVCIQDICNPKPNPNLNSNPDPSPNPSPRLNPTTLQ